MIRYKDHLDRNALRGMINIHTKIVFWSTEMKFTVSLNRCLVKIQGRRFLLRRQICKLLNQNVKCTKIVSRNICDKFI